MNTEGQRKLFSNRKDGADQSGKIVLTVDWLQRTLQDCVFIAASIID
jgi:hypothetical protein